MNEEGAPHRSTGHPLQEAFDAQAAGLGLELQAPTTWGRDMGAFVRWFRAVVEPGVPRSFEPPGQGDETFLKELIYRWEQMLPDEARDLWKEYATDPFLAVGRGAVGLMNEAAYESWRHSDELAADLKQFPPFEPRVIRIIRPSVSFVGNTTAVVTYSVEEDYQNRTTRVTNAGVIALKIDADRWKVAAETIPEKVLKR